MEPTEINEAASRTEVNSVITRSVKFSSRWAPRESFSLGGENCVVSLQHPHECDDATRVRRMLFARKSRSLSLAQNAAKLFSVWVERASVSNHREKPSTDTIKGNLLIDFTDLYSLFAGGWSSEKWKDFYQNKHNKRKWPRTMFINIHRGMFPCLSSLINMQSR